MKKRIFAIMTLVVTCLAVNAQAAVTVKVNNIISQDSELVSFDGDARPIVVNDTTLVPARVLAEHTGMEVEWDQAKQTAIISIAIDGKDTPIAQFAKKQIEKLDGYGLGVLPEKISAALTVGSKEAEFRYVFVDADKDEVCVGKKYELAEAPVMVEGSSLMIPLRDTVMMFGMQVSWDQEDLAVSVSLPDDVVVPGGLKIMPSYEFGEAVANVVTETVAENDPITPQNGTYLGRFKITHYCPCYTCNGGYTGTAWAGRVTPGQTIAVDPKIIPPLSWVYIDGYGLRRAEDCGGAIKGNKIDMAVSSHAEAYRKGVVYCDVWLQ